MTDLFSQAGIHAKAKVSPGSDEARKMTAGSGLRCIGSWTRSNPEMCLLATMGKPKRLSAAVRQLIVAPRREHSRKPDEVYERIEHLVGGPYLEMYSRTDRTGWDAMGNQTGRWAA